MKPLAEGDLLQAGDVDALAVLQRADELAGLEQAVVGAGVEPGVAAGQVFDEEVARFQVDAVEVGDLQLAARRGLQIVWRFRTPGRRRNRAR